VHFRIRPKAIQVIRTTYDPATKGAKSQVLGRIDRQTMQPTRELKAACSPKELKEIAAWIDQYRRTEAIKIEAAARTLANQAELASDWFDNAEPGEARVVATDLSAALNRLRARMKRRNLID
jgi:hypothetical protein